MQKEFTFKEALKLLDLYDKIDYAHELIKSHKDKSFSSNWDEADEWEDFINENNLNEATQRKGKIVPEVGDIAILKIKLRNTDNKNKNVYEGFERRPVLIIRATSSKVDALEITHKEYFKDYKLIPIGKLLEDDKYSYINIYTIDDYSNLDVNYKFPLFKNKKPLTKAEYNAIKIGVLYNGKDKDETCLSDFNYRDNYKGQLSEELLNKIITLLINYYEESDE